MYRVSLGLVSLLMSVLLVARNLDFLPDPDAAELARRQCACEAVAIECALLANRHEKPSAAAPFIKAIVARRGLELLSVGLRDASGKLLVDCGDHAEKWKGFAEERSSPSHLFADIPRSDGSAWGRVELCFTPLPYGGWWRLVGGSLSPLLAFCSVGWFLASYFYLRTVFRRVDMAQAKVVPQQVRNTLNTLAEGVLVLNKEGTIALANDAFGRSVGSSADELRGKKVSDLPWNDGAVKPKADDYPWVRVLRESLPQMGRARHLRRPHQRGKGEGIGGGCQQGEERVSREREPRNSHADERHHGHDGAGPRRRPDFSRAPRMPGDRRRIGWLSARSHQRPARPLED
jgi:PAS domain-containing protein